MSVVYVDGGPSRPAPAVRAPLESRRLWVESLDGRLRLPFDGFPVKLLDDSMGLEEAPVEPGVLTSPDFDGGSLEEILTTVRPMLLHLSIRGVSQEITWAAKKLLRDIIQPGVAVTPEGSFKVGCSSLSGTRELVAVYQSGLEGDRISLPRYERLNLRVLSMDPFSRDRTTRSPSYGVDSGAGVMVSTNPATAGPRMLGSSVVLGQNIPLTVGGEVPVWPRLDFIGPFSPLTVDASTGLRIRVPGGVPEGSTLTIITDPRHKSIRLNDGLASGMLTRDSWLGAPFRPGTNFLNVEASGANPDSRVIVTWRAGWRSLW